MKKIYTLLVLFFTVYTINAQDISPNAIGLRAGDNDGFGTEVNYQKALSEANRLELGLGWRDADNFNAYRLTGIYQWVWSLEGNFNWYAGAGAALGSFNFDSLFVNAAGNVGIEYDFDFPLLLSLDFRPAINVINNVGDSLELNLALGVRYQF